MDLDAAYGTFPQSAQDAADMRAYEQWRFQMTLDGASEDQMSLEAYADWWVAQHEPED